MLLAKEHSILKADSCTYIILLNQIGNYTQNYISKQQKYFFSIIKLLIREHPFNLKGGGVAMVYFWSQIFFPVTTCRAIF